MDLIFSGQSIQTWYQKNRSACNKKKNIGYKKKTFLFLISSLLLIQFFLTPEFSFLSWENYRILIKKNYIFFFIFEYIYEGKQWKLQYLFFIKYVETSVLSEFPVYATAIFLSYLFIVMHGDLGLTQLGLKQIPQIQEVLVELNKTE